MAERDDDNRWRAYDEAVRRGPALSDVSAGEYRPSDLNLAGAGVRGYGGERWGRDQTHNDRIQASVGTSGDQAPFTSLPPDFGRANGDMYGRSGGWTYGDTGMQRRRGPKGYKRSDDRICEDICEHLMNIGHIDSSDVEVRVRESRVTLEGTVPERSMKYEIEDIAAQTLGVDDVENNITVPRRDR
jgi:hypothetical protein